MADILEKIASKLYEGEEGQVAELVQEALDLTQLKTKREVVHLALLQLVERHKRKQLIDLRGKIHWEGDLDEMRQVRL